MLTQFIFDRHFRDLNPILYGEEACEPGHRYGPAIRKYHLIHYVERGSGIYEVDGTRYPVSAGEAFLILPGKVTVYTADENDPWAYRWIGFNGELAHHFDALPPVVVVDGAIFPAIREGEAIPEYRLAAGLFSLCASLLSGKAGKRSPKENQYVRRVQDYVRLSYMSPTLRVEGIARQMNLNRRYLSRIFRDGTGMTLQEFLISVRMREAANYLRMGHPVSETARLCGYTDPFNFSKMFKKTYGVPPASFAGDDGKGNAD